jgi:hypothetical protein
MINVNNSVTRRQPMKHATVKKEKVVVGDFSLLRMFSVYGGKVPAALPEPGEAVEQARKLIKSTKRENGVRTL